MDDIFKTIRVRCAGVAARARHVRIHEDRIPAYAAELAREPLSPSFDPVHHFLGTEEETAAYVVTLDTINFGSGYFPHLRKRPGMSGYFTVATALAERFRQRGPLPAAELASVAAEDCAQLFGQPMSGPTGQLMELFARALRDLGSLLLEDTQGSPALLIEAAAGSAERLIRVLARMPFFRDVEAYRGEDIPFYKRAQLMAADLALALPDSALGAFDDLDRLTIFADNVVPHVLRVDGILEYDPQLAARIDREQTIAAGSEEEVEIRAGAVHAVERLVTACGDAGRPRSARELDFLLWNRGRGPAYKARPRHRTRTVFY